MTQMVGKTKMIMEKHGLFQTHLNNWNVFTLRNQDCGDTNTHFDKAYKNILLLGSGVDTPGTIPNAQESLKTMRRIAPLQLLRSWVPSTWQVTPIRIR